MCEHKLKNRLLKTVFRKLDDIFVLFLGTTDKRIEMKWPLYCLSDAIMNVVLQNCLGITTNLKKNIQNKKSNLKIKFVNTKFIKI